MPNVNAAPRPGERNAVVIGHFYPRTFAWQIRTGALVDRAALADAVAALTPYDLTNAVRRASGYCSPSYPVYGPWFAGRTPQKFQRITAQALRKGYSNDNRDIKGHARMAVEKMLIRAILELAAAHVRTASR